MARGGSGAMDQLYNNDSPAFTTWVIENDLLKEPFVVTAPGIRPRSHAHGPAQLRRRQGPASLPHSGPDERCS